MANRFFPNYETYAVTSPFGDRILNGNKGFHNGIDLVAKGNGYYAADEITAHSGGTVEECGYNESAGNFIRIRVSDTAVMSYCHFRDKLPWKKGDFVKKGAVLGFMGSTGNSTGAHLHWGINENGKWIDPTPYLDKDYLYEAKQVRKDVSIDMRTLRHGDRGEDVRTLQILLCGRGESLETYGADGEFGNETKKAVKHFQANNGLESDGICGVKTWKKLLRME